MRNPSRNRLARGLLAAFALLALGAGITSTARAQGVVGTPPERSPFLDLDDGHRVGFYGGWFLSGRDPVGVNARSGPLVGVRYDALMGGPAYFTARLFGVVTKHDAFDPNRPDGARKVGTSPANLVGIDGGFALALTGERTWRSFQPLVHAGLGVITGIGNGEDVGGYTPAFSVLYSLGAGARYSTGRNSEVRADWSWHLFKVRYPVTYRTTTATDNIPIRAEGSLSPMTANGALTLSWTWGVFR